ncbi:hypothetical protein BHJ80_15940 [Escherichia coli]|nr:hypothetical protein BHJ80_15940 [Escherichia coli]
MESSPVTDESVKVKWEAVFLTALPDTACRGWEAADATSACSAVASIP